MTFIGRPRTTRRTKKIAGETLRDARLRRALGTKARDGHVQEAVRTLSGRGPEIFTAPVQRANASRGRTLKKDLPAKPGPGTAGKRLCVLAITSAGQGSP